MNSKVIVIYYHEIAENGNGSGYQKIELNKFFEQIKYISKNKYETLLLNELDSTNNKNRPIIITFDDGFRSIFKYAYPIMKKYNIKGNVFLATSFIGKNKNYMDWDMVSELYNSGLFYFGSHTHTHIDIRTVSKKKLINELRMSNNLICENLDYTPQSICFPYGKWNNKVLNLIRNLNMYKYVFASHFGSIKHSDLREKLIPRYGIRNSDNINEFIKKLDGKKKWIGIIQRIKLLKENLLLYTNL